MASKSFAVILLVLACLVAETGSATAQQVVDARRVQVQAAETDAIESLRRDVMAARLAPDMTVADFLDRAKRDDALDDAMRGATQVGGTRWIDDQTCIIRFELQGERVAAALTAVATALGKDAPIPADDLARQLVNWSQRTFSATGSSTAARYIVDVRAAEANPAWQGVAESDSRHAVDAARSDAVRRVFESLRAVPLGDGKTMADALKVASVKAALRDWLGQQPVCGLEFGDDLEVRMTIAAPADEVWAVVRRALSAQQEVKVPSTDEDWNRLRDEVTRRVARAVGRSHVAMRGTTTAAATSEGAPVSLPIRPPDWVYAPIEADGAASGPSRSLKTARRAEDDAAAKLREQLYAFVLTPGQSVGDLAKTDPRVEDAVGRALLHARTYRVQWGDSGVAVRMTLDPQELWDELRSGR